ncbi:MAG: sigma-54-dependent Fis family transcriptional regulator [Gammaproteobacteria bacterium]|nr:sigma-54-dependent Fis family transcriptional regulator [Gammaproteobacteria bacterium]
MIGHSPAFLDTIKLIKKFARCDAPILIEGETGTGKEMAARAIHYLGNRRDFPFIPVNCGAIPDNLLENELFGHEKGAFTDACSAQPGIVELAHRGTLFLDEVDTLSSKAQVALLRFIQSQEYRPLGSHKIKTADVRIVTATNSNLERITQSNHFREDLMFRLNVLTVTMPPLRERSGDIEPLAQHLLKKLSCQYRQDAKFLHPDTLENMKRHSWPGNVRELENVLHREFLLSEGTTIHSNTFSGCTYERRQTRRDRRTEQFIGKKFGDAKASAISEFESTYLQWLINATNGNISEAARRAGKERRALGKLIKKYNLHCNSPNLI